MIKHETLLLQKDGNKIKDEYETKLKLKNKIQKRSEVLVNFNEEINTELKKYV